MRQITMAAYFLPHRDRIWVLVALGWLPASQGFQPEAKGRAAPIFIYGRYGRSGFAQRRGMLF